VSKSKARTRATKSKAETLASVSEAIAPDTSWSIKTVLEIIGGVCAILGFLGGLAYSVAKLFGITWMVITPGDTLDLTLEAAPSGQAQLQLGASLVLDNRGFGNTLITGIYMKMEFSKGDPLLADDVRCVSTAKESLSLPIPVPASDRPLPLQCTASRLLQDDRVEQLASGVRRIQVDFVTVGTKPYSIAYCLAEHSQTFWQRLVNDPRPANRHFNSLCEGS
jgi:hypothetical protein